jgi:hypothetical protein
MIISLTKAQQQWLREHLQADIDAYDKIFQEVFNTSTERREDGELERLLQARIARDAAIVFLEKCDKAVARAS